MRQIKFRAWAKGKKAMLQVGDQYGTTHDLDCCNYCIQGQDIELMQYTGLKDKNGVEIFEGDVVNIIEGELKIIGEICFQDGVFGHHEENRYTPFNRLINSKLEIIGNVHQNPELLEAS